MKKCLNTCQNRVRTRSLLERFVQVGLDAGAADLFGDPAKGADIVKFLESIGATTLPFAIPAGR